MTLRGRNALMAPNLLRRSMAYPRPGGFSMPGFSAAGRELLALQPGGPDNTLLGVVKGIGGITNVRASSRLELGLNGLYYTVPAGELATHRGSWLSHVPAGTNHLRDSSNLPSSWTTRGACTITYNQPGLTGDPNTATLVSNLGEGTVDDVFRGAAGLTPSAPIGVIVWLKKVTQTGTLTIRAAGAATGQWNVDLSQVSSVFFDKLVSSHPAVNVITPFMTSGTGAAGMAFESPTGPVDVIVGNTQQHDNVADGDIRGMPPIITGGAAASIDKDGYQLDLANHDNSEVCYFFEWQPTYFQDEVGSHQIVLGSGATGYIAFDHSTAGTIGSDDGVLLTELTGLTYAPDDILKIGVIASLSDNLFQICVNGSWSTPQAYTGYNLSTYLELMTQSTKPMRMRNLQRWGLAGNALQKAKVTQLMA